ncbi:AMP-binding protein [Heyndrickxia oleronia]|uniref:AMP-binding protein n=1 Tax=Heyndrickxia oleronia TaxID=38875 RepID=A0AAW6T0C7_9BACI|nr:AMP-binding protein [Heyndrickxia oleronia]MDH5162719.1 AMP-binding protein [Heyndrickxia oleronia]
MNTITSTYIQHRKNHPERIAIQTINHKITYNQLFTSVFQLSNWFLSKKESSNKIIAILLPNGIPFLQIFAGAVSAGWIVCPLDLKWSAEDLKSRIDLCSPSMIITIEKFSHRLSICHRKEVLIEQLLAEVESMPFPPPVLLEDVPFYMGFTSGSTGKPKAFVRSHSSWVESFKCNVIDLHLKGSEDVLIPGGLIHSHFLYGAISTLYFGGTIYLLEKYSVSQLKKMLQIYPIKAAFMVPTMIESLLKTNETIEKPLTIVSSGAKWEHHSKLRIKKAFPLLRFYEYYGASELSFVTVLSHEDNQHYPNSVGKPCHNVELQIRKKNGELALIGEAGKIFVRSKMSFLGYKYTGETSITPIIDKEGWMTVHDIGYLDSNGYLYINGRENNMILYGGINIFPEEIEAVLSLHPNVKQVAVIGLKDRYWGEIVTAVVKGNVKVQELKDLCKTKLSSYKVPRKWMIVDKFPLTSSGKIARDLVKKMIIGGNY